MFAVFLQVAINFRSAIFRSIFLAVKINYCLTARSGRKSISEGNNLGYRYMALLQRARAMLFLPTRPARTFSRVSCSTPLTLFMIPSASLRASPLPAAILRIAPSRKHILRPQLRVQAILLLNILSDIVGTYTR